jgi:hypothetical protein
MSDIDPSIPACPVQESLGRQRVQRMHSKAELTHRVMVKEEACTLHANFSTENQFHRQVTYNDSV